MNTGSEKKARHCDHDEAGVQRIKAGKELARLREILFDGSHATKKHGGVDERITPREVFIVLISPHP
jgi:hypothetical protein